MANSKKRKVKKKVKKTTKPAQSAMSPIQYMKTGRARTLEIGECLISADWENNKSLATIVVSRLHVTGNSTFGVFMVDKACLGLKNTTFRFNIDEDDYEEFVDLVFDAHEDGYVEIDYDYAHSIIYGSIDYAHDLGFEPEKDWAYSQFVLKPKNDPSVAEKFVEFGVDGKPFYFAGPYDRAQAIIEKLNKAVGEGNYEFFIPEPSMMKRNNGGFLDASDFDDEYFDEDDFDDDDDDDDDNIEDAEYEEVKS